MKLKTVFLTAGLLALAEAAFDTSCKKGDYWDGQVEDCQPCTTICTDQRYRSACEKRCPGFLGTDSTNPTIIWGSILMAAICLTSIVVVFLVRRKWRKQGQASLSQPVQETDRPTPMNDSPV